MNKNNLEQNRKLLVAKLQHDLPVLRARLGLSQEELASMIGISRQSYNTIETGKKEMSWMTFMAFIAVFQNNEETKKMLFLIDGLEQEIKDIGSK